MKLPRHEISQALAVKSLSVRDMAAFSKDIAAYLISERRSSELESILRDIQQYRADHGIVEVTATSAFPLTPTVQQDITVQVKKLYPRADEVIISHVLDQSIVGGVQLDFANSRLDLSVRGKLNRLKQLTSGKAHA